MALIKGTTQVTFIGAEQIVGKWVDNKTIFRQVFALQGLADSAELIAAGIVDFLISATGSGTWAAEDIRTIGNDNGTDFITVSQVVATGQIILRRSATQPAGSFAALEYTKI